jgi:hypothetical protein
VPGKVLIKVIPKSKYYEKWFTNEPDVVQGDCTGYLLYDGNVV